MSERLNPHEYVSARDLARSGNVVDLGNYRVKKCLESRENKYEMPILPPMPDDAPLVPAKLYLVPPSPTIGVEQGTMEEFWNSLFPEQQDAIVIQLPHQEQ